MKTSFEIPDAILRRAKSKAAELGIPLRQFVTEALAARLQATAANDAKPWMKYLAN
jgi:hypothetical protein